MRLNRLQLIKFGKFSDTAIDLPTARQDFHLIVGANEAGKSTLRSAISDLLFGIPTRSVHGFKYPLSTLRLGATVANATATLEFHRAKAPRQSLRSPLDAALAESCLAPFLGTADRTFFDQMFGLDHARLIKGGNSILNAEDSVGQILFQSAAGVAGLGKIRDAYAEEGERIWGSRHAKDREYYIAADALEKATTALKDATVRTRSWSDASARVVALGDAIEAEVAIRSALQSKRNLIERIRRVRPFCTALKECEAQLAALENVVALPADAQALLAAAEIDIAQASQLLGLRSEEVTALTASLAAVELDDTILARTAEVEALENQRLLYGAHARDIVRRQAEIDLLWKDVIDACEQLSWAAGDEATLRRRLPSTLVRRELDQLMLERGAVEQSLHAARQAQRTKADEIAAIEERLGRISLRELPPALRAALAAARALGDPQGVSQAQDRLVSKAREALAQAMQSLGRWCTAEADLSRVQQPGAETIARLLQERQLREAESSSAGKRLTDQNADIERIALAIAQFEALHHPVTQDDVVRARAARSAAWEAIKQATTSVAAGTAPLEAAMQDADAASDKRLDNVEEATELQALSHERERAALRQDEAAGHARNAAQALAAFDRRWEMLSNDIGVPGMALDMVAGWMASLQKALACAATVGDALASRDAVRQTITGAAEELAAALRAAGQDATADEKPGLLCARADATLSEHDAQQVRHAALGEQLGAAQALAAPLATAVLQAGAQMQRWDAAWAAALDKAGLAQQSTLGTVTGALELLDAIESRLGKIRIIRLERIDAMQDDLARFAEAAQQLAQAVAPALLALPAEQIARTLASRLAPAQQAQQESVRLAEMLRIAQKQVAQAGEAIRKATATLQPMMDRAGVASTAELARCIERSDARRAIQAELAKAQASLLQGGDGLSRPEIEAEVDAADLGRITAELEQINDDLSATVNRQAALSAELATARRTLDDIEGSAGAAQAEAMRQEALARMTDASERFVKVATAGRLLRWSIERYREQKQGPMLARAGEIFSQLTLGSFQRLLVDFDRQPMTLEGQRHDDVLVGVSGMSDGTRDQLFLALRLAALEMHLEQANALPFIADDLFINFDDARSAAGLHALARLSEKTQVIFLSHHDHLIPTVRAVFGAGVNVVQLGGNA